MPYSTSKISFTKTTRSSSYEDCRTANAFLLLILRTSSPLPPIVVTIIKTMQYDYNDDEYYYKNNKCDYKYNNEYDHKDMNAITLK